MVNCELHGKNFEENFFSLSFQHDSKQYCKIKKTCYNSIHGGDYFDNWENNINEPLNLVLQIIKENKYITYNEIAVKIKKSRSTVLRYIQKLRSTGKIIRHGADKDGYWETVE